MECLHNILVKVFKNGPSKICGRQPLKKLKRYGLLKGTVMQIEKTQINDRLRVSKVFSKFRISTIYNFPVIYP